MPRGDSTGPAGMGPMTGRAAGFCAGFEMPGYTNNAGRRGLGTGFGRGFGFGGHGGGFRRRNRFSAPGVPGRTWFGGANAPWADQDPASEKQALKTQAAYLEAEINAIKKRLDELTAKD